VPVLWLALANKDGRLGPKFRPSTADCPITPPPGIARPQVCIMRLTSASLVTAGSPMIAFVNVFSQITGRTVVQQIGLAPGVVLPGRGTLVIMEACAPSLRQRAALTACATLPLPGIVG
jgi:hypothetical protein